MQLAALLLKPLPAESAATSIVVDIREAGLAGGQFCLSICPFRSITKT